MDGVTVEIVYEGRTHNSAIADAEGMNQKFEDVFADADEEQRRMILGNIHGRDT